MLKKFRWLAAILLLLMALMALPTAASAASVAVSAGSSSVKTGDTVTVKVTFKGSNIGVVQATFSYDKNVLEYVSGSNTSNGKIVLYASEAGKNSLSASIKFKAKKAGSTNVSVKTTEMYSFDEESLGTPAGSAKVTVKADASATKAPSSTEKPASTKKPAATKKPEDVKATPKPEASKQPSQTEIPAGTPEPAHVEAEVSGTKMLVYMKLQGVTLPEGAERSEAAYGGQQIEVAVKYGLQLAYLTDASGKNGQFYQLKDGKFFPYTEIAQTSPYTILPVDEGITVPEGFSAAMLTLENISAQAWVNDSGVYLFYAMDDRGEKGFYTYDYAEGSIQRYVAVTAPVPTIAPSLEPEPAMEPTVAPEKTPEPELAAPVVDEPPAAGLWDKLSSDVLLLVAVVALGVLCIALLIVFAMSVARHRSRYMPEVDAIPERHWQESAPRSERKSDIGKHGRR